MFDTTCPNMICTITQHFIILKLITCLSNNSSYIACLMLHG